MPRSAGLLLFRRPAGRLQVLLVHPGGPYFARKDAGVWTVPKGLVEAGEPALETAKREFTEETSFPVPDGELLHLGEVRQQNGKLVEAWAVEGDCDPRRLASNTFELEWPPRSGRMARFPEVDRGAWFRVPAARQRILPAQIEFLDRLEEQLG